MTSDPIRDILIRTYYKPEMEPVTTRGYCCFCNQDLGNAAEVHTHNRSSCAMKREPTPPFHIVWRAVRTIRPVLERAAPETLNA